MRDWRDGSLPWIIVGIVALLAATAGVKTAMLVSDRVRKTRGFQNNNPGNLRKSSSWIGLRASTDEFAAFLAPEFGIRAMALVLQKYFRPVAEGGYGLNTLRALITRYAPPSENDTEGYIKRVSARTGLPPDAVIDFRQRLSTLVSAMIAEEIGFGEQPYPVDVLTTGLALTADPTRASWLVQHLDQLPSRRG